MGSENSSFCHLHLEGHDCDTLTSPPMSPVVEHPPFPSPLLRKLCLGNDTSSVCSSNQESDNSNVLLADPASVRTSALAEEVHETALVNSAIYPDSSNTSEAFPLLVIGDVIAKTYLYDECKAVQEIVGWHTRL
eukprot:scaffold296594_cov70-Attheya_sp.AAC.3